MSSSGLKSKAERLEAKLADLRSMDRRERAKAAREMTAARLRLGEIAVSTQLDERLIKEAEAEYRRKRAARYDRKAALIGEEMAELGERLRRLERAGSGAGSGAAQRAGGGSSPKDYRFDAFLSFAGEQREYVKRVADGLIARGHRVFYDAYEKTRMWGTHMTEHFDSALRQESRRCVPFISRQYREKDWTRWEWRLAQERALKEDGFLLPARFDDTEMPALPGTVNFVDLRQLAPEEFAAELATKLGPVS